MAARLTANRLFSRNVVAKPSSVRSLATVTAKKHTFLVVIPDVPGSSAVRSECRPTHLKNIFPYVENRSLKIGGPILHSQPKDENDKPDVYGSVVIWAADSQQEVLEILKKDVYVEKGVWDFSNVKIYPFKPTFEHQF
ncbi:hypothetical protein Trco_007319 [Trichoderma cornu-damae]|uniref:YCII-related domain-containing protein n=1 Tax=Trichoderma cornu-damae TaxID=654480 RepID=A0A9P8QJ22_9HYPO|nr:hypothetical protein Trco_007319 [Trichoderma cornu-damae]